VVTAGVAGNLTPAVEAATSRQRRERWPREGLVTLGLELETIEVVPTTAGPTSVGRLVSVSECPERFARRVGVPFKRPLF
jgi:hypothetical protein